MHMQHSSFSLIMPLSSFPGHIWISVEIGPAGGEGTAGDVTATGAEGLCVGLNSFESGAEALLETGRPLCASAIMRSSIISLNLALVGFVNQRTSNRQILIRPQGYTVLTKLG